MRASENSFGRAPAAPGSRLALLRLWYRLRGWWRHLRLSRGLAAAQSPHPLPTFELERLQFEPSGLGSLVVGTGRTLEPGVVRVSLQVHIEHLPLNFVREWDPLVHSVGLVQNRLTGHVTAAVGVLPWLQLGA